MDSKNLNKTVTEKFCLPEHYTRLVSLSDSANDMVMIEGSYSLHENLGQFYYLQHVVQQRSHFWQLL